MNLYPTILTGLVSVVQQQIDQVKDLTEIETVQIDVIDGFFTDNVTVTPLDLVEVEFGDLRVDLHLMTEEPLDYVYEFLEVADQIPVRAVIGQVERMSYQRFFIEEIKKRNWQAGLSLDLYTPIESIDEEVWSLLDLVQVVGVEIGFQGGQLHQSAMEKIINLEEQTRTVEAEDPARRADIEIIVDGGIKLDNVSSVLKAGADSVAVGSALWTSPDLGATVRQFQSLIN